MELDFGDGRSGLMGFSEWDIGEGRRKGGERRRRMMDVWVDEEAAEL
jgi:hypothetical protein